MKISVIMPVYNETIKELHFSIRSILTQTYNNFEFIIIDDNPSSNILRQYLLNLKDKCHQVKIIFNKKNIGSMLSADKALRVAKSQFIARMDADDIAKPDRLQKQLDFCLRYNLDFSCCNYQCFYNNHIDKKLVYPSITQVNQHKIKRVMSYINIAIGPTLFFKRNILNKIGLYRNMLCEDYDLTARALIYGYRMGYLSDSLVYKRDRSNNLSSPNALKEFVICSIISKYLRKYRFKRIVPLKYLWKVLNNIKNEDKNKYFKFLKYSKLYKQNKTFMNFLYRYIYAFSSKLMCKRTVITHFSNLIQNILLR